MHKRSFIQQDTDSVCGVEAQWFSHWQDHLKAFGTHDTHRHRTGHKSHTIYRKINFCSFRPCSWSSGRFCRWHSFRKTNRCVRHKMEKERKTNVNSSDGDAHQIHLLLCIFPFSAFRHSVEHKRLQHTAHSYQSQCARCDNTCVIARFGYVSCAFIPFNSASLSIAAAEYISFILISFFVGIHIAPFCHFPLR